MKLAPARRLLAIIPLVLLPGCLATQTGRLEVLNPKQAYGRSLAVVGDLHRENEAIEQRLASDLRAALAKRGLTVAEDPAKADLVVVPTLGRMRERAPAPVAPEADLSGEPVVAAEPVRAVPAPEARPFHRFSSANVITRGDVIVRRTVPSARAPVGAQQAGLLLTAYRAEDFLDYGVGRQSLPPVWRIYVSQPAMQLRWNSIAVPLISAAASAAKPLGKSKELGAGSMEQEERAPAGDKPSSRESRAERTADGPKANRLESSDSRAAGSPAGEINTKDQTTDEPKDDEPEKGRKLLPWFGGAKKRAEAAP